MYTVIDIFNLRPQISLAQPVMLHNSMMQGWRNKRRHHEYQPVSALDDHSLYMLQIMPFLSLIFTLQPS